MLEETVIAQCSPTMAGIKTGNLFSCHMYDKKELLSAIRKLNGMFVKKGVRLVPLKYEGARALLYMYRPDFLREDFHSRPVAEILEGLEYPVESPECCVMKLSQKLNCEEQFPHEIGLFLGYPPEDVKGFIQNKAENAKYIGAWKVYGDVNAAKRKFAQYESCTSCYMEEFHKDNSLERLVVAVS